MRERAAARERCNAATEWQLGLTLDAVLAKLRNWG